MMPAMNTGRCVQSTLLPVLAGLAGVVLGPGLARADGQPAAPETPPATLGDRLAPPPAAEPKAAERGIRPPASPAEAMAAFHVLEGWVRALRAPEEGDMVEPGGSPPGAACVTLRLDGRVIAMGADLGAGQGAAGSGLRAAAAEAIRQTLANNPVPNDALREENLAALGKRLEIGLELAGELIPIRPRTYADVDLELSAGIDGVATRVGEQTRAVFPSFCRRANQLAGDALAISFATAASDPSLGLRTMQESQPGEAGPKLGASFYRFATVHLSQGRAGEPPIFLYRGGRVVDERDLSMGELRQWGGELAGNLVHWQRAWKKGEAPPGTYWPWLDKRDPPHATAREVAVAAYALARYARTLGVDDGLRREAAEAAASMRAELADARAMPQDGPADPAALAFTVLAAMEASASDAGAASLREGCEKSLAAFYAPSSGWSAEVPPGLRGLAAFALVEAASRAGESERGARLASAEAAVRSVYAETPPGQLVSHLPWLGWAELSLARQKKVAPAAVEPLRAARARAWEVQVRGSDADESTRDLVGGIVFPGAATPIPGAQSARVLAFFATMLGRPEFTAAAETPREMLRVLSGMRFLRQLTVRPESAHDAPDRAAALGGVCMSPWDQRQPPEATAVTLLGALETLRGCEAAGERLQALQKSVPGVQKPAPGAKK
jgi:hypothetical protein